MGSIQYGDVGTLAKMIAPNARALPRPVTPMRSAGLTDRQLVKIARDFRRGMIGKNTAGGGFCAMVCWPLSSMLNGLYGVKNECVSADLDEKSDWANHVWIKLADGRVLDPTFDQFCSEEPVDVYLGLPTEFHSEAIVS